MPITWKSIGEVANYKSVSQCGMEELAFRQRSLKPTGGVLFARNADGDEKREARQSVLDLFHPDKWNRPLHMLTMPSVQWRFERLLLATREEGWLRTSSPRRTFFTSVENDRSIYFAGIAQMPGVHTPDPLIRRAKIAFAEQAVRTKYAAFLFATIEDLMRHDWEKGWHAAWLDYTGPLTTERMEIISNFYKRYISEILVITALQARWDKNTSENIDGAGGYFPWLRQQLPGEVLHEIEYFDTSPMAQFAVRKTETEIIETKIKFVQRDQGGPTMAASIVAKHLHTQFGDLPIVEAKEPLRLQPIRADVEGAIMKDPCACVFARCAQRQFGATRMVFWKSIAYVDLVGKDGIRRIERFLVTPTMMRLIERFDRGEPIEEGRAFILNPPSAHSTRHAAKMYTRKRRKTELGKLRANHERAKSYYNGLQRQLAELKQQKKSKAEIDKIEKQLRTAQFKFGKARAEALKAGLKLHSHAKPRTFEVRNGMGRYNIVTRESPLFSNDE
jgi:hypothetical protein